MRRLIKGLRIITLLIGFALFSGTIRAMDFHIELISISSTGLKGNGYEATASANGRLVAFMSYSGLVPGDTDGFDDIYVRDRQLNTTTLVSVSSSGVKGNSNSLAQLLAPMGNSWFSIRLPAIWFREI